MPCGIRVKSRRRKRKTYYVSKDVGRPRHHYLLMKYRGRRGRGKYVGSKLKRYKR